MKKQCQKIISVTICSTLIFFSMAASYAAPVSGSQNSGEFMNESVEEIQMGDIQESEALHLQVQNEKTQESYQVLQVDEKGRPTSARNGDTYITIDFDDEHGILTKYFSKEPYDGTNYFSKIVTQKIEKNEFGSIMVVTYEHDGVSSSIEYDENDNITKEVSENGDTTVRKYNGEQLIEKIYPYTGTEEDLFYTTHYEYNNGLQTAVYIPAGQKSDGSVSYYIQKNEYDEKGNVVAVEETVNAVEDTELFSRTEYTYDDNNNLVMTKEYDTDGEIAAIAQFYYDQEGHRLREYTGLSDPLVITGLDQVSDGADKEYSVTKYEYDGDYLVRETDSRGNVITYAYNADGLLSEKIDKNGMKHVYTYRDATYKESEKIYFDKNSDAADEEIEFVQKKDNEGNWDMLTCIESKAGTVFYEYDSKGNLTKETDPNGNIVSYTYDNEDRVTGVWVETADNSVLGATKYVYDQDGNIDKITDDSGRVIASYEYNNMGKKGVEVLGNGLTTEYEYNKVGSLNGFITKEKEEVYADVSYDYSVNGNIVSEKDVISGADISYDYDGLNRLSGVIQNNDKNVYYEYDESGNCITVEADEVIKASYDQSNHIVKAGNEIIKYDACGNLIQKGETKYKYDYNNRLIGVEDVNNKIEYQYDIYGHLIGRTLNGEKEQYIWANDQIVAQIGEEETYYYNGINGIVASRTSSGDEFYVQGKRGDIIAVTNELGDIIESYKYTAYGEKIDSIRSGAGENVESEGFDLGYTGSFYDNVTGLIYLNARFYSPELGVFMTEDTVRGQDNEVMTLNRYAYCTNNPINYVDKTGHWRRALHESMSSAALDSGDETALKNCIKYTAGWTDAYLHYPSGNETLWLEDSAAARLSISSLNGYLDQEHCNYEGKKIIINHTKVAPYHGRGKYNRYLAYILGMALQFKKGYQIGSLTLRNDDSIYKQINFDLLIRLSSLYEGEADGKQGEKMTRKIYSYLILGVGVHLCEDLWAHTALVTSAELATVKNKLANYNALVALNKTKPISCLVVRAFSKDGQKITESEIAESDTTARGQERQAAAENAARRYISYFKNGYIMYSGSQTLQGGSSATGTDAQRLSKLVCSNATHNPTELGTAGTAAGAHEENILYGPYICNSCKNGNSDSCNRLFYSNISGTNNKPEMGYLKLN